MHQHHYPDIIPIPEIPDWTQILRQVAAQPLQFCPDFPELAARHEAWWNGALEGAPLFDASIGTSITRGLELLDQTEAWLKNRLAQMQRTHFVGDSIPRVRVDFGPVMLGGLCGGKTEFISDTTWTHSFINDDWSNAPDWQIHEDNPWWSLLLQLFETAAQDAVGRYLVMAPDLGGSADVLLNLRGSEKLCMDVIDQPEQVKSAVEALYPTWRRCYRATWSICHQHGAGFFNWVGLWSNQPYMVPACDFNYMIGPREFNDLFLPDIVRQSATVGRAIFHLDGPGASRHIDALLETPEIQAIQYVTGAGNSALAKLPMLKKIQAKGRSLQVVAPANEILTLCDELRPESLAFIVTDFDSVQEIDSLYTEVCQKFKTHRILNR